MRHYSRSHGSHCYLRSFKTTCPKCGDTVLYWECTHGSKVFFQYPPYGKLQRHYCRKQESINKKKTFPIIVKTPKGLLEDPFITCPVCGRLFKEENALKNHLKSMQAQDFEHQSFFQNKIVFEKQQKKNSIDHHEDKTSLKFPKFGRISFKQVKKE